MPCLVGRCCRYACCRTAVFRCQMPPFRMRILTRSTGRKPDSSLCTTCSYPATSLLIETSTKSFQNVVSSVCYGTSCSLDPAAGDEDSILVGRQYWHKAAVVANPSLSNQADAIVCVYFVNLKFAARTTWWLACSNDAHAAVRGLLHSMTLFVVPTEDSWIASTIGRRRRI